MERWWETALASVLPNPVEPEPGGVNFGTVTFDPTGGGPMPQPLNIAWGSVVGRLRPMERGIDGFLGWFDENGEPWDVETRPVRPEDDVNGDGYITLKARWMPISYTVSFDSYPHPYTPHKPPSNPADIAPQSIAPSGNVVQPVNPPQLGDGRGFAGWQTEQGVPWDFANNTVTGNMTLFASYQAQTRTVHFEVNGGRRPDGSEMTRIHFTIPISYGVVQDPGPLTREGHAFDGWYTDPALTNQWIFATDRITHPDAIIGMDPFYLYAKWVPNIYIVTFDANGGTPALGRQDIVHGERAGRPDVTRPGMVLTGWFTDAGAVPWDFDANTVTRTMSLHARWETATYTVTFNLRIPPGTGTPAHPQPAAQLVLDGGRVSEPFMPPLAAEDTTSWSFYRWDYSSNGSSDPASFLPWDFDSPVNANLTLHARWVPPVPGMVWVPRGSFIMGDSSVSGSPAAYHAYPTRRVTLDGFYIARHPVTQEKYESLMTARIPSPRPSNVTQDSDNRPVERVSWYDAIYYTYWLTETRRMAENLNHVFDISGISRAGYDAPLPGTTVHGSISSATVTVRAEYRLPNGFPNGYRLPTEAEWEFAARGGYGSPGGFMFAGSNSADAVAWYNATVTAQPVRATQPVGRKAPNALGIYDLSGNVSEWCWDWFAPYASMVSLVNNPSGPAGGTERVRRGGAWNNAAGNVRSVVRNSEPPANANWVVGFRVVRGPSEYW
ncbi:MAG: SUMF1/EgtB/PvdO family nonheme iron enzyme [Treponema sp.]|nr:SUMF1/EgtB/PvdO family nonheme iron enzyme [Treponema sp.]